ncbi:hypothetical protein ApAK_06930 [Thermoplasmatales archaeon AK]|nr:hypothetical protein [Thermoplasmatales archaeon AK]
MPRRREFAHWVFSRELRDSRVLEEKDPEEKGKPYVISPLGTRIRRVIFSGTLTQKSDEGTMIKATVTDNTSNFYLSVFSNEFNQAVHADIESIETGSTVIVMGRVNPFKTEEKLYININPEMIARTDDATNQLWKMRARHIALRKTIGIKLVRSNPGISKEDLVSKGYTDEEANCILRSVNSYPDYDLKEIEAILAGSTVSLGEGGPSAQASDFILEYIRNNDLDGRGCRYEDILEAARNAGIDHDTVDEVLNTLGSNGDIFEVSLKRYKAI